jgi:hypothetical protein
MKASNYLMTILGVVLCTSLLAQDTKPVAGAPGYKVGDEWRFKREDKTIVGPLVDWTERVERLDANDVWILQTNSDGSRQWWQFDAKTAKLKNEHEYQAEAANQLGAVKKHQYFPVATLVQFPLDVGRTYPVDSKWTNSRGQNGDFDLKAKVSAYEKTMTAAGEIEAFRIEYSGWWTNRSISASGRTEGTVWYVPDTKRIVKSEGKIFVNNRLDSHRVTSMVEFKPAP